jgi:hypothetical protein
MASGGRKGEGEGKEEGRGRSGMQISVCEGRGYIGID